MLLEQQLKSKSVLVLGWGLSCLEITHLTTELKLKSAHVEAIPLFYYIKIFSGHECICVYHFLLLREGRRKGWRENGKRKDIKKKGGREGERKVRTEKKTMEHRVFCKRQGNRKDL